MMKRLLKAGMLAVSVFVCGSFMTANAQSVSGSIGNGTITRGKPARATVLLNIPGGLHVNSSRPGSEYAIPTRLTVSASGAKIGPVSYPRGRNLKFEFSQDAINVFEGRNSFGFNVTVPKNYRGSTVKVNVTVRYQACTNEVCYPPTSKKLTLSARVK